MAKKPLLSEGNPLAAGVMQEKGICQHWIHHGGSVVRKSLLFQQVEPEPGDVFGSCGNGNSWLRECQGKFMSKFSNPCICPSIKTHLFTWRVSILVILCLFLQEKEDRKSWKPDKQRGSKKPHNQQEIQESFGSQRAAKRHHPYFVGDFELVFLQLRVFERSPLF